MKKNRLTIHIKRPIQDVFQFTTTPPNSIKWIPGVIKEETTEWPVRMGTVYKLTDNSGKISNVTVSALLDNEYIEWISEDHNYHCKYTFRPTTPNTTELEYAEWVDGGDIDGPFTLETLQKLKTILEKKS